MIYFDSDNDVTRGRTTTPQEILAERRAQRVTEKLALDLKPGDTYKDHRGDVTILREKEDAPNQFGLPWFKFWAKCGEREGYVSFGPTGMVTLA